MRREHTAVLFDTMAEICRRWKISIQDLREHGYIEGEEVFVDKTVDGINFHVSKPKRYYLKDDASSVMGQWRPGVKLIYERK